MQWSQEVVDPMASQRLDPQGPLPGGWQHDLDREELGNLRLQSQTVHASRGDDHATDLPLAHFAQARVHIAADVLHLELHVQQAQLRPAVQAARANTPGTGRPSARRRPPRPTNTSRTSSRGGTALRCSPGGSVVGISFILCTARSIS
jgi:hypothetical protein